MPTPPIPPRLTPRSDLQSGPSSVPLRPARNVRWFTNSIIPILSFAENFPELESVFVPECGGRWGKPADLEFRVDPNVSTEPEPPPSITVENNDEYIKRHGLEVAEDVIDPKTGEKVIDKYNHVCFIKRYVNEREERKPLPGGIAVKVTKITEIIDLYVDASNITGTLPAKQKLYQILINSAVTGA